MTNPKLEYTPTNILVDGKCYVRIPVKTHLITRKDNLMEVVQKYTHDLVLPGDIICIAEKVVAITQGRSIPVSKINSGHLAEFLCRTFRKRAGLCTPETMQVAVNECGRLKMIRAFTAGWILEKLGKKDAFDDIAGYKAIAIAPPSPDDIPPFNTHIIMAPLMPDSVAVELSELYDDVKVAIIHRDAHNLKILGASHDSMNRRTLRKILIDNPLGQHLEQTPIGIIRKI
ncbi:coenzyme F420-0:L-glutamate ligase [Fusibacter tunisiensis]|uniref:Coenzyme F420:L-glutamate ligase-like domain-containing protein n=1 Tax=Fusibacter tunisiensis TaxID=1008308 RepID=A0ABS2MPE0_9FIRM|nr:coenzyme F420-0:L-glutamate ligase [Fusibacter tunisiensis]MBM7561254.1 hypothetical protein [Fusibacter tunisiensis]